MKCNTIKILFYACIFSIVTATASQARDVTLQWDPSTDPSVTGYKVEYNIDSAVIPFSGTGSTAGVSPIDIKNMTSATVGGLDPAKAYYFAVIAYNAAGTKSGYSNIVSVSEAAPPTVSITSPAANATISGTVSVAASATDNVGVTQVEYYLNGALKTTDTSTPYVYSLSTTSLAPGTYTLMAKAYDAAGNVGQSSNVSVTVVNDTIAPIVSLTAPGNNLTVSGTTTVTANASDNVGVSKVEFYKSGVLLYATNVAPFSYSWNTTTEANGSYTLIAKAYDNSGNVAQSANVLVTVNNIAVVTPVAIPQTSWKLVSVDSQELVGENGAATNAFDGNSATFWHTQWSTTSPLPPHELQLDLGAAYNMTSFSYLPRQDGETNGMIAMYEFYVSADGVNWGTPVATGTFDTTNSVKQVNFAAKSGRYIKLRALSEINGKPWTSVAELNVFGTASVNPVDITVPTVSVTAPANNATVSGTISVTASASDNVGVSKVEFYVNGVLQTTDTASPYTFSWITTTLSNAVYTLTAKAYDAAGNVGQSTNVLVTVNNPVPDTTAPSVSVTAPANNATVSGTISVTASASDNVGVSKVEFYVNSVLQATDSVSPYTFSWNTTALTNGSYTLTTMAYDAANNVGQSTAVTVTVNNSAVVTPVAIPQANWKLVSADSQELVGENGAAANAFDGNSATFWHTQWSPTSSQMPHQIQIDLGAAYKLSSFSYLPRQDNGTNGNILKYKFYVSADGVNWGTPVATGTFSKTSTKKKVNFTAKSGRFIKLQALSEINGNPWTSVAELNVFGTL